MARYHIVRVGVMGNVGRFRSPEGIGYPRGARVIVRTARGLETGEVLAPADDVINGDGADGALVRGMTVEDELLFDRLTRDRDSAYQACSARISQRGLPVMLMDVEHLFDGRSLIFYFLGEEPPELEGLTAELAELYDTRVNFRQFAETLANGCGPDCGTEAGGGCQSCTTCAVAEACGKRA